MKADQVAHNTISDNPDLMTMHITCKAEEALINRIDIKHTGFVTETQLEKATKDHHLSAAERKTAAVMLLTAEDLRFQRMGFLPSVHMGADSSSGPAEPWRPAHLVNSIIKGDPDKSNHIKLDDVKTFDKSLALEAQRRADKDFISLSEDIMKTYAKKDPGKRLLPSEVWSAVADLSKKPNLTNDERNELDILKYTQVQMRAMYPHGKEPADHHSKEYRQYIDTLDRIPAHFADMMQNGSDVFRGEFDNQAISDTYSKTRPWTDVDTTASQPSPPSASDQNPARRPQASDPADGPPPPPGGAPGAKPDK